MARSKALATTLTTLDRSADILRAIIVAGCAAALILAGPPLPF